MKLGEWAAARALKPAQLTAKINEFIAGSKVTVCSVRRYQLPPGHPERRIPREPIAVAIFRLTRGAVPPCSFYALPKIKLRAACRTAREASARPPRAARGGGRATTSAATLSRRKVDGHGEGRRS